MADRRAQAQSAAIGALRRIRAVESTPDADGVRTVWHQGAQGAELVSWVRGDGRVMRQDFTLVNDHFQWTSDHGVRTGEVSSGKGSRAGPASGAVTLDDQLSSERVFRAVEALKAWDGDDRYITHLKRLLNLSATGFSMRDESTVTEARALGPLAAGPPAAAGPRPVLPLALALAAAAAGLLGALIYWLL